MGDVLWDGFGLSSTHSGVGRYALEVAEALAASGRPPAILPTVPHLDRAFLRFEARPERFKWGRLKPLSLWVSGRMAEQRAARSSGITVFHGLSNYNIPRLSSSFRSVLTVHDLIPLLDPEGVSAALRVYLSYQMPKAIERADVILCVSQWTAETLKARFPAAEPKLHVLLNGKPAAKPREARGLENTFRLLTISRGETYKRLELINAILPALPERFEWHLLSDAKGHARAHEHPRLVRHQNLSEAALEDLWSKADALVHPSLLEGYCLPAASAVAHGIPTLLTSGSGIGEVVGPAGYALEPGDKPALWVDAILKAERERARFPSLGAAQWSRLPSWTEVGQQINDIYARLLT